MSQLRGIAIDAHRRRYTDVGKGCLMLPCSAFLDAFLAVLGCLSWVVGRAMTFLIAPLLRG